MASDIELIADAFRKLGDEFSVSQLKVKHSGVDDDGLWFFRKEGSKLELQLESSSGQCPFLVESNQNESRVVVGTAVEANLLLQKAFE